MHMRIAMKLCEKCMTCFLINVCFHILRKLEASIILFLNYYDWKNVKPEEIEEYNFDELNWLLERGVVYVSDGMLALNYERIWILKELNDKGVICLQYKDSDILRKLISEGEIRVESSLLSESEWEYFNYVLNKSEFSNGLDLRNRYIHDTNSLDKRHQQNDYIVLLKMFVILVIKINEEFCLQDKISKKGVDFYEL